MNQDEDDGENDDESRNDNECTICNEVGDVICCDTCPKVFHLICLGLK